MLSVPIVFFGTLEIAWLAQPDVVLFREGLEQGLWNKCKNKSFHRAMIQVLAALSQLNGYLVWSQCSTQLTVACGMARDAGPGDDTVVA